jgi:hypothetical protein
LKVNFPPYLLIVDLFGEVDEAHSAALVRPDGVTFRLVKVRDRLGSELVRCGSSESGGRRVYLDHWVCYNAGVKSDKWFCSFFQKNPGLWGKLAIEGDKRAIAERREKSVEEFRLRAIEVSI